MAASLSAPDQVVQPTSNLIPSRKFKTQVEKIGEAIENGEGDFYFFVGSNSKKLGGITCFLKCLSPGLGKLISDADAEGKDSVVIEQEDEELFCLLLKAICTNKWTERKEDVIPLMVLAEKYEAKFVVDLCVKYLTEVGINADNAVTIFQDSQARKVVKYEDLAWKFIVQNTKDVVGREDFRKLSKKNLEKLMMVENDDSDVDRDLMIAFRRTKAKEGGED